MNDERGLFKEILIGIVISISMHHLDEISSECIPLYGTVHKPRNPPNSFLITPLDRQCQWGHVDRHWGEQWTWQRNEEDLNTVNYSYTKAAKWLV